MSWLREHLEGQFTARVTLENGRYRASVDELSYSVHVTSLEEAQRRYTRQIIVAGRPEYHIEQFAYLTQRMKEINEGEGTLLDNSILMCTSSLFDGDAHRSRRAAAGCSLRRRLAGGSSSSTPSI